jgi:hypothetical protein
MITTGQRVIPRSAYGTPRPVVGFVWDVRYTQGQAPVAQVQFDGHERAWYFLSDLIEYRPNEYV